MASQEWNWSLICLAISLASFAISGLFGWLAIKKGELYALGTPINRKKEPGQFWVFVVIIAAPFFMLGLFFFQAIFR